MHKKLCAKIVYRSKAAYGNLLFKGAIEISMLMNQNVKCAM